MPTTADHLARPRRGHAHDASALLTGLPSATALDNQGVGQVLGLAAPHVHLEEAGVAVAPLAVLLDPLGHRHPQVGHGDAAVGEAQLGIVDQVADDGGVVVGCHNRCSLLRS
jgi:hypothetical protein